MGARTHTFHISHYIRIYRIGKKWKAAATTTMMKTKNNINIVMPWRWSSGKTEERMETSCNLILRQFEPNFKIGEHKKNPTRMKFKRMRNFVWNETAGFSLSHTRNVAVCFWAQVNVIRSYLAHSSPKKFSLWEKAEERKLLQQQASIVLLCTYTFVQHR